MTTNNHDNDPLDALLNAAMNDAADAPTSSPASTPRASDSSSPSSSKRFAFKAGALVVGLAMVAYVGLRLGRGDLSLLGAAAPDAVVAHVLTPEEQVAAEVKANPALVSRQACVNLYLVAPGYLGLLAHPTLEQLQAMSIDELRSWVVTASGDRFVGGVFGVDVTRRVLAADLFKAETTTPRFTNVDPVVEARRINAYLDTCRSLYPGRDETAASIVRVHAFTVKRFLGSVMSLFVR
ncbi:hypothetical protein [Paraburkholderia sp. C35]|uniref:hypothetical protein n=1 Tax=Paraburkholderia sp. C35 TaxID=2126993 RepID=UPI000D68A367|nr:hypothetical protein [Paraburkholderia sp. C35]